MIRSLPGVVLVALAAALVIPARSSAQKFGGSLKPRYAPDRALDVEHVALDVAVDPTKGSVVGKVTIAARTLRTTRDVVLHAGPMTITSVTYAGLKVGWRRRGQRLLLSVPSTPADKPVTVVVEYSAEPKRGMYFVRPDRAYPTRGLQAWTQGEAQDNRFWFPSWDYPNDRFSTEIKVKVPVGLMAVSNGRLLSETSVPGGTVFHWKMTERHVNYLVTLAIAEFVKEDLGTYDGRVELPVFVAKKHVRNYRRSFDKTAAMMKFLEDYTGRKYPYSKYAQVVVADFMWGGMENTTATTLTELTIHDEKAASDWSSDGLVMHELAHQWFGDLITCRDWSQLWLNEGFATYLESLFFEVDRGPDEFDLDRVRTAGWYLGSSYRRPIDERRFVHPDDLFDGHTYAKAASVLHMLRHLLGPETFKKGVRRYVEAHADGLVEAHDLRRAMEAASGRSLGPFFAQWVERSGHPELGFDWRWDSTTRTVVLEVVQSNPKGRRFDVTLPIVITGTDGVKRYQARVRRGMHTFNFSYPSLPSMVEVDPRRHILMERLFEKDARELAHQVRHGSSAVSRRWAADESGMFSDGPDRAQTRAALVEALRDDKEHYSVRRAAAERLGSATDLDAIGPLMEALENASDSRVREAAAVALGEYGDAAVLSALEDAMDKDRSYKVVAAALRSYAAGGADDAVRKAEKMLQRSSHREVIAKAAVGVLTSHGGDRGVEVLLKQTRWGRPHLVRAAAARALGRLGRGHAKRSRKVLPRLLDLTRDPIASVVSSAVDGLRSLSDLGAVERLKELSRTYGTRSLRRSAAEAARTITSASEGARDDKVRERVDSLEERVRRLDTRVNDIESR